MILVAVAATARKRYPRPIGDRDSFTRFLLDEMDNFIEPKGFRMGLDLGEGQPTMLEDILYTHFRCNLVHEGQMPKEIILTPPVAEDGTLQSLVRLNGPPGIPEKWILNLHNALCKAPENVT